MAQMSQTHKPSLPATLRQAFGPDRSPEVAVTINEIMRRLEHQALAVLIFLFALPNMLPTPPGTSAITGLPLIFLTFQMVMSRPPWLPGVLARREISAATLHSVLDRAEPWMARVERAIHPRLAVLTGDLAQRLVGLMGMGLSMIIMLPIPFGNTGPALSLCLIALGLSGRDGVWVILGLVGALTSVILLVVVYGGAIWALMVNLG